ncbi:hypothetical protein RAAC3_TM7C00001G0217 [Candidatus Saccharibacteria bacterium RAAC3_TM7_1]|nr:hypothetical protein RAAC3_TM7C00001G0217 [Candidatus Saccharibacteria bacterium RAAC3_TM7_1]
MKWPVLTRPWQNLLETKKQVVLLSLQKNQNDRGGFRTRRQVVPAFLWRLRNSAKASNILVAPGKAGTTQPGSCRYPRPRRPLLSPGSDDVTNNNLTSRGLFEDALTCQWHVNKPEFRRRLFIFTAAYQVKEAGLDPLASLSPHETSFVGTPIFHVKVKRSGFGSLTSQRTGSFSYEG